MPSSGAARQTSMVAPTERRERSTICGVHGSADLAHLGVREFAADHSPQITGVLGAQDFLIGRCVRLAQRLISAQPRLHHALAQK